MKIISNALHTLTIIQLDELECYLTAMEDSIHERKTSFIKRSDDMTKSLSKAKKDEYWDFYIDEYLQLSESFPSTLRYSILISLYSIIEFSLVKICTVYKKRNPNTKSIAHYKGSTISKVQQYLKNDIGIKFPEESKEWKTILNYNKIRNNIVHNNGRIYDDKNPQRLFKLIEKDKHLTISDSNEIQLKIEFCSEAISNSIKFIDILFSRIEEFENTNDR